jgi:dUTP pyrophosphatase
MLNRREIEKLIKEEELITGYIDVEAQLTPNGFDFTVGSIFEFVGSGALDFSNKERAIPQVKEICLRKEDKQDKLGWWNLKRGAYKIRTNESINLPNDLVAIAFPRSSLLRMGVFTQTAVWDAGFRGKSEFVLMVENPRGLRLKQNARIIQIIFIRINKTDLGYQGIYRE